MKKSIFLFFAAILCATSAWAGPSFNGGCVYFHNKGGWNDTYKYICISNGSWTEPRAVTVITNTQLWYNALPTSGWGDAKYMSAMGHNSSKSQGNFNVNTCNHYTANASLGNWGFNNGNAQMLTPASGSNNANLTLTYVGNSYSSMNKTITVKAKVSTNDGVTYSEATSPGTLSASSYAFTSYTSCNSAKSLSNGKITCGYTANTTLTAADADGYTFDGWYNASGTKQTADKTLSINPTADATYYAYYTREALAEETHDVTISYMCGSTSIKENKTETGVGISTPSEISAPAIDGYKFDSWSFGTGVQSTDAETANPIDITTKTSGIYTLTANYSELPKETVYFINTPKWTGVKAYAYSPENHTWPGVDATKEAEKIGEYEVYSYTATAGKYANVIFNGSGGQTADLAWTSGKYYIHNYKGNTDWYTKEDAEALLTTSTPEPAELAYNVTVPAGTNVCYICGNMTGWKFTEMTKVDDTHYTITIEGAKKDDGYKYASGSDWGYVEKDADGNEISNRTWAENDVVARWASVYDPDAVEQELTYSVTVPEGTYACYIAMDTDPAQDGWEFNKMTKVDDTHYTFTRTGLKNKTYKYASGPSWDYVEKTSEDGDVADRQWAENDVVAKWQAVYDPTPIYTVNVTAENGTVTGANTYKQGATATLTAAPAEGYEFVNWTKGEEIVSTENPYTFTVTANVDLVANFKEAEPVYQVIEDEITNFVFDTEAWPMVCQGGPSATYQIQVLLVLTEAADGTLSYEDCSVSIMGTDATFIEGTLFDLNVYAPSADAVLRVQWNEEFYELHLAMSAAAAAEPIVVVVEDATVQIDTIPMFGDAVDYALKMTADWTYVEDGVTYPVLVEVPVYYPEATEPSEMTCTVTIGGEGEGAPWLGFGEGPLTITTVDGVVTAKGIVANPSTHVAFDVTISGTLPVEEPEGPTTALDNLNTTVAPVKMIENGQLIIVKDGVQYNAQGAILK